MSFWKSIVLSSENNSSDKFAKTSRNAMRERVAPLQNSKSPRAKWAAKPPTFGVLFCEFRRGGMRSRIFFLEVFARGPLITAHDNTFCRTSGKLRRLFSLLLSSERINGQRAKTSRKTMRERVPPLQNSKNPHAKWAAKPPTFGTLFWSFGGLERACA